MDIPWNFPLKFLFNTQKNKLTKLGIFYCSTTEKHHKIYGNDTQVTTISSRGKGAKTCGKCQEMMAYQQVVGEMGEGREHRIGVPEHIKQGYQIVRQAALQ